ncbi:hypothetical protein [Enterococcus hermanniensis]|uniref:Uncharacterized protein n=1 Tax=Enterococcus hermanniensis TaxID=249189 RepID=A0A1L8TPT0_9ENTE|nr:hypothetical protein [Enterococcus hermanniensis]OJG46335.1 hypothetical protein RV04_GL001501 [Enterococcus hermanniensis]
MNKHPFTMRQLFHLKPETLEKRITIFYAEKQDAETLLRLIIVFQVRAALGTEGIEKPCCELVRNLYIQKEYRSVPAFKRFYYQFEGYFSQAEWQEILQELFPFLPKYIAWKVAQLLVRIDIATMHRGTVP